MKYSDVCILNDKSVCEYKIDSCNFTVGYYKMSLDRLDSY